MLFPYDSKMETSVVPGCEVGVGIEREYDNGITFHIGGFVRSNGIVYRMLQSSSPYVDTFYSTGIRAGIGYRF